MKAQSVLALFGSGLTTGLSVDLGHATTAINPVYEGGSIIYANMETNLAGNTVTSYIADSLAARGFDFGSQTPDVINGIKENCLYVTTDATSPRKREDYMRTYKLPSGEVLDISDEVFFGAEMYFQPDLVFGKKTSYMPLQDAVVTSAAKCDSELQTELYDAVVTHGGLVAGMRGFNKRLASELEAMVGRPVNLIGSPEAYAVSWLGGATFAGLDEARKIWVYKKEFEEFGERIVRNRF